MSLAQFIRLSHWLELQYCFIEKVVSNNNFGSMDTEATSLTSKHKTLDFFKSFEIFFGKKKLLSSITCMVPKR